MLEVVSSLTLMNTGHSFLFHSRNEYPSKYNPKIYLSFINSIAYAWTREDGTPTSYTTWPESYWLQ